ncbi:hypothetical protein KM295_06590 [Natronomonas sp. F2-12]|jgi:hypothetical protein|uniref:Uncharacterized protein n=1 Tax=Natronomonas aquatica TaxID=2841590 RepID=A0A9R1CSN4_9EURY|nr:hypothetical protein [Natronomonas aquatica]MCQ4333150.1 hypothetical protein [Natronomonas aquatica]
MLDHPRLTSTDADEPAIALTLDPSADHSFAEPSRETFVLSARAAGLLVEDLEYDDREEIAPVTTRTLLLTGGAYVPEQKHDPVDLLDRLRVPDGGKHPTASEIERVAAYLENSEIEQRARWLAEEVVAESRLSEVMEIDDVRTRRERMNDLREIAKDL